MTTTITAQNLDAITSLDLRKAAEQSLKLGPVLASLGISVTLHRTQDGHGRTVETLVVGARAGQCTGGDSDWGDWDEQTHTLRLDARGPEGEALVVDLAGGLVALDTSSSLSDVPLLQHALSLLPRYPATREALRAVDAEWKRRGSERFATAMAEVAQQREAQRAEHLLGWRVESAASHLRGGCSSSQESPCPSMSSSVSPLG